MKKSIRALFELLFVILTVSGALATEEMNIPEIKNVENSTDIVIAMDGPFIAYDNGTVLDTRTKLIWPTKDNGSDINWANAKIYCENYRGGGFTDWRMPTVDELLRLYDAGKTHQSIGRGLFGEKLDIHLTELIRLTSTWVWASETSGSNAGGFGFRNGDRYRVSQSYVFGRALPVRSGK